MTAARPGFFTVAFAALPGLLSIAAYASGRELPPRPEAAATGSAFIARLAALDPDAREDAILSELRRGNVPAHLRHLVSITLASRDDDGRAHRATVQAMPDYLAVGSDADSVRLPMRPSTAQAFCDTFGFALPTRKVVEESWRQAALRLWPQPLVDARESPETFLRHDRLVEEQLRGRKRGSLVAGIKKDIVITPRLREQPGRVAIFGWHKPTGEAIQPLSLVHRDSYVDYSHGVRPVLRRLLVDGRERDYLDVLADPRLCSLLSDEGLIPLARYER